MLLELLFSTLLVFVKAQDTSLNCPLLGPDFPAPQKLLSSKLVSDAGASFLNSVNSSTTISGSDAISVSLFSLDEDDLIFEYHNSPAALAASPHSVRTVDSNSIYRIGSISKLFTVWTFLIKAGDSYFNQPITKFVPELAAAVGSGGNYSIDFDEIDNVRWEEVTVGAVASYMAGITRDGIQSFLFVCLVDHSDIYKRHLAISRCWGQVLWILDFPAWILMRYLPVVYQQLCHVLEPVRLPERW